MKLSQARHEFVEAERAYNHASRVVGGQRLIFYGMTDAGIRIPKACKVTHKKWMDHKAVLYLNMEHARANLAMAEVLSR